MACLLFHNSKPYPVERNWRNAHQRLKTEPRRWNVCASCAICLVVAWLVRGERQIETVCISVVSSALRWLFFGFLGWFVGSKIWLGSPSSAGATTASAARRPATPYTLVSASPMADRSIVFPLGQRPFPHRATQRRHYHRRRPADGQCRAGRWVDSWWQLRLLGC